MPLTVVYEDFIREYGPTVWRILHFLELDGGDVNIAPPAFERLADDLSEAWVQRFREEHQAGWEHRGW